MNKQEIFDTVVNHLRTQGKKAVKGQGGICMYRAPDGSKCAAGVLIPDEIYDPKMEGRDVRALINPYDYVALNELFGDNLALVAALQTVHDGSMVSEWEVQFEGVAKQFGLIYTPPVVQ